MSDHDETEPASPAPETENGRLDRLEQRLAALDERLAALERMPDPTAEQHPMLADLTDFANRAAASGLRLSHLLELVASQLLGHDLRPMPPKQYAPPPAPFNTAERWDRETAQQRGLVFSQHGGPLAV